jgi:hypothetical protein
MLSRLKSRVGLPSPATLLAVIAMVVATGGVSKATVPDSEGLIHACVTPQTGEMRILDPDAVPALCKTGQYLLTWSARGPEGDEGEDGDRGRRGKQGEQGESEQGPTGPTGPTGSTGPTGPGGIIPF